MAPIEPSGKHYSINCDRYPNIPQSDSLHEACILSCSWAVRGQVEQDFFMRISSNVFIQCCRSSASPRHEGKSADSFQNPFAMNLLNLNWSQFITILCQGRFIIMGRGEEGISHETRTVPLLPSSVNRLLKEQLPTC